MLVRKKSWGRLGAAIGVVALLVGGLVGVAAPAQAVVGDPQTIKVDSGNSYSVKWLSVGPGDYDLSSYLKFDDAKRGYSQSDCEESGIKRLAQYGNEFGQEGWFWKPTGKVTDGPKRWRANSP